MKQDFFKELQKFLDYKKEPKYRYGQITKAIFDQKKQSFSEMTTLSKDLRTSLAGKFKSILAVEPIKETKSRRAVKFLFELEDKERIETVLMNYFNQDRQWRSLCVSSQVGCNLGCKFCATGQIGLKRNLDVDEIIGQVLYFILQGDEINTISFMGMGEPLLNPNIFRVLEIFTDDRLFNISQRKINVSTVGILPNLKKLIKKFPQVNIAFSLHTPFQKQREKLMPIAKQYSIEEIMAVLDNHIRKNNRKVFLAYLMLKDVNDTKKHLNRLMQLILGQGSDVAYLYHVNLIRYSPTEGLQENFQCSDEETIEKFRSGLEKTRIGVTVRQSFGEEIEAACGQLYAKYGI